MAPPGQEKTDCLWHRRKILFKIYFLRGPLVAEWLAGEFTVLGYHFQNWMLVALVVVLIGAVLQWLRSS
jgi:hypothetical protein